MFSSMKVVQGLKYAISFRMLTLVVFQQFKSTSQVSFKIDRYGKDNDESMANLWPNKKIVSEYFV